MKKNPSILLIFLLCAASISTYAQKKDSVQTDAGAYAVPPPGGGGGCTAPSNPSNPTASTNGCGPKTLTRSSSPPPGTVWYWQTVSYGTSIANSSSTFTATQSGTYYLRAYKPTCDLWSSGGGYVTVTVNNPTAPSTPSFQDNCSSGLLTRGTPPSGVTWYWQGMSSSGTSTANSDPTYTATGSGTYYIRSYQSGCWGPSTPISVSLTPAPSTPPTPVSSGNSCGDVTLSWNGTPPSEVRWYWQTSSSGTSTGNMTSSYTTSTSGTYFLRAYHLITGCWSGASQITVNTNPVPSAPATPSSQQLCGQVLLTRGTPPSGETWYWQDTNPSTFSTANANASYYTTSSGTYYLRSRNNTTGCWSASTGVTVSVTALPAAPTTPTVSNSCGNSVLTRGAAPSGVTWYWQGLSSSGTSTTNTDPTYTAYSSGTYYIRSYQSGCWGASTPVPVTITQAPSTPPIPLKTGNTCGDVTLSWNGTPSQFIKWCWQTSSTGTSMSAMTSTFTVSSSGTYYLRAYDMNSDCWSPAAPISVTVNQPPPPPTSNPTTEGNCSVAVLTRGEPPSGITWYWVGTDPNGMGTSYSGTTYNATSSGTYYLRARYNSTGCWSTSSASVAVTIYALPSTPSTPDISNACGTGVIQRTTPAAEETWYWQGTNPQGTSTSDASQTYTVPSSGTYYLRARNNSTSCWSSSSSSVQITINPLPAAPPNPTIVNTCGTGTLQRSAPSAGYTYYWQGTNPADQSSANSNLTYQVSASGTYHIRTRDNNTLCWSASTGSTYIGLNAAVATPTVVNSSREEPGMVSLSATVGANGDNNKWYDSQTNGSLLLPSPSLTFNPSPSNTTTYYVSSVNTTTDCESLRVPITATIYPKPVVSSPSTLLSMGGKILLSVSNNTYTTYQWKLGSTVVGTSSTYEADRAGSYTVTVTKIGMTGSGTSVPVELQRSIDDQVAMNYLIVNNVMKEGVTSSDNIELLPVGERTRVINYIGGLGNSLQSVFSQVSPLKHDIIQTSKYDALGRQLEQYLPYTSDYRDSKFRPAALDDDGYTNSEQYDFYQRTNVKIDTDTKPYAIAEVAPSPLQRMLSVTGAGDAWHSGGKKTINEYKLNRSSENIRRWKVVAGLPASAAAYPDYELQVTITTDENSHQRKRYVDKRGRTVLEAVQSTATEWLRTAYVYDDFGRLAFTISPEGVKTGTLSPNQAFLDQFAFQYRYDALGRLIEYKAPAGGWMYTVYDKLDRPVLTQNADQRTRNEWAFVKYDVYGRPITTGYKVIAGSTRTSIQSNVDGQMYQFELPSSDAVGYTLVRTYPTAAENDLLSISYYDNYDFLSFSGWDAESLTYGFVPEAGSTTYNTNLIGLPTGGKIRVVGGPARWLNAVQYYDKWHRPLQITAENHLGGLDRSTNKYNTLRQLSESRLSHNNGAVVVVRKISYDHSGRMTQIFQNINDAQSDQLVAQYEYNEIGQMVDKKLHNVSGTNFLQSIDYRYNIRGWIASINNAQLTGNTDNNDEANDFFGIEYLYETPEAGLNDQTGDKQYFNGNISAIKWKGLGASADAADQQSYKFKYDQSGRLTTATSQMKGATGWTNEAGVFNENMTYDHNGNIQTLQRNHAKYQMTGGIPSYVAESVDNLTYTYNSAQKNQLLKVEDTVAPTVGSGDFKNGSNQTNEYTFNSEGNLTADLNKGISSVQYNVLGKVSAVQFSDGRSISYLYDAAGNKLKMTVQKGTNQTTTDYVGGFVYENSALQFFGSPEGRVVVNGSNFEYEYAIADHQGNTRVVFTSATPSPNVSSTNFETHSGQLENFPTGAFRSALPLFNHTEPTGTYSQLLNGGYQGQVGVGKSFAVYPGDKVKIEAYAKYEGSNSNIQGAFATALLAAFNLPAPAPGETGTASAGLTSWGNLVDGGYQSAEPSAPQAHVNIIIFDKNHNFIDLAYEQISAAGEQVGVSPDVDHEYLMKEYTMKEAGFVYLYVSNNSPVNVYFDDVIITHTPTNVIQYNEYYPFGLQTQNSWTRAGNSNNFLYNGGSELNKDAGWYETFFRGYDAALGRFSQVDPLAGASMQFSPYAFAFNNPVFYNDPGGAYPENTYVPMPSAFFDGGSGGGGGGSDDGMCPTCFVGNAFGGQYTIGYGSGNYWADGMQYSDWSVHGGSQMFRDAKGAGARLIGGTQYLPDISGRWEPLASKEGKIGYWRDYAYGPGEGDVAVESKRSVFVEHQAASQVHANKGWFGNFGELLENNYSGGVIYDGSAWYGTNFIGPGPTADPYKLTDPKAPGQYLKPKDMVDAAAQRHDYYYYKLGADGVTGALFNTNVTFADQLLAYEAYKAYTGYYNGSIDPVTGNAISPRTRDVAFDILVSFGVIGSIKSKF